MADRLLDRAFNRVYGSTVSRVTKAPTKSEPKEAPPEQEEQEADSEKEIKNILSSWKDKDYFKLLHLPPPTVDALGRPTWGCSGSDVSRAYRRLSILVHPDKNPGAEAREAFEALNQAHRDLKDSSKLEEILKAAAEKAKEEAARQEARATVAERIQLNANKNAQARSLRAQEGSSFRQEIVDQMRKRQMQLNRRQQAESRSRRREESEEEQEDKQRQQQQRQQQQQQRQPQQEGHKQGAAVGSAGGQEDEQEEEGAVRLKKRKKPTFI